MPEPARAEKKDAHMTKPNNYALIIGVHEYRTYDPSGRSDVAGALNDARTWVRQCLAMGFSPERVRVLTSPVLAASDLGPPGESIHRGEATHDGIVDGITWLMNELGGEAPAAGIMTFSGHGEQAGGQLLLCPSDTTSSLTNVIDMLALRRRVGSDKASKNLSVLIDGCHGQVGVDREQSIRARLSAKAESIPEVIGVTERVIASCKKDQVSVSSRFGGERIGAFTWAITSALGQWKVAREDGVARSTVSYGELVLRSRALLSGLSFEQEPVLSGPPGVAELAFLHPGEKAHSGETSAAPNGRRPNRQLDAGSKGYRVYTFNYNNLMLATVLVPAVNSPDGTWSAGEEYWFVSSSIAGEMAGSNLSGSTTTVELSEDNDWTTSFSPPTGTIEQMTAAAPEWTSFGGTAYRVFADTQAGVGLYFVIVVGGGGARIDWIYWFNPNEGYFYFNNDSQVGATLTLPWTTSARFNYSYYAQVT